MTTVDDTPYDGGRPPGPAPVDRRPVIDEFGALRHHNAWISVSAVEQAVLRVLIGRFGKPVSREAIAGAVWPDATRDRHTIDIHVYRLRPRLRTLGLVIHTLRGRGFMLDDAPG